jgi:diguanylate cyclase (GGDEF)-like protein
VLYDENGAPDYFAGAIRNHSIQENIDTLTGLSNQYGFMETVQDNMAKKKEMEITLVGIGRFAEFNDVYGYHFGNKILQRFARKLYDFVGDTGSVFRLDGTKFVVIGNSYTSDRIRQEYEKFRFYCRTQFKVDGKNIILDLNAGHISVKSFDIDPQTVYACLSFVYSESKLHKQGDMVEFLNTLNNDNSERIEKLHVIRGSIMKEYEGFYLLYQPVVDSKTEKLIGGEALIRWKSERYGTVRPDHFIPLLEKDPLFPELGKWILRTALIDAKKIMKLRPEFVVNVNLSYTQLEKGGFVDMVLQTLKEQEFPPDHLCLEITERCRLLDMDILKNVITTLRSYGVKIALDDFGTGFSSIGLVKNLPFDTIKIDRSFVLRIEEDEKEKRLVENFVNVAATFGAKVCIEGIETAGMKEILQKYRVQSFQGYYYAKPIPVEDLERLLTDKDSDFKNIG